MNDWMNIFLLPQKSQLWWTCLQRFTSVVSCGIWINILFVTRTRTTWLKWVNSLWSNRAASLALFYSKWWDYYKDLFAFSYFKWVLWWCKGKRYVLRKGREKVGFFLDYYSILSTNSEYETSTRQWTHKCTHKQCWIHISIIRLDIGELIS